MNFGRLAGNDSINRRIYEMFGALDPADIHRFVRKFRSDGDEECFHTVALRIGANDGRHEPSERLARRQMRVLKDDLVRKQSRRPPR
jgi:hypothetical protein